jgi:Flp pilus assembly protein TadB
MCFWAGVEGTSWDPTYSHFCAVKAHRAMREFTYKNMFDRKPQIKTNADAPRSRMVCDNLKPAVVRNSCDTCQRYRFFMCCVLFCVLMFLVLWYCVLWCFMLWCYVVFCVVLLHSTTALLQSYRGCSCISFFLVLFLCGHVCIVCPSVT